jgi:hypothetical protein
LRDPRTSVTSHLRPRVTREHHLLPVGVLEYG